MTIDELKEAMKYSITYQPPYSDGAWKIECFSTEQDAMARIAFYCSCGTPAYFI